MCPSYDPVISHIMDIESRIARRFGSSNRVKTAVQQALTDGIFTNRGPGPSGLQQHDALMDEAQEVLTGHRAQQQHSAVQRDVQLPAHYQQTIHAAQQALHGSPASGQGAVAASQISPLAGPGGSIPDSQSRSPSGARPDRQSMAAVMRLSAEPRSSPSKPVSLSARIAGPSSSHDPRANSPARPVSARLRDRDEKQQRQASRSPVRPSTAHPSSSPARAGSAQDRSGSPGRVPVPAWAQRQQPDRDASNDTHQAHASPGAAPAHRPRSSPVASRSPSRSPARSDRSGTGRSGPVYQSTWRPHSPVGWTDHGYVARTSVRLEETRSSREALEGHGEEFYRRFKLKQHKSESPDYKYTQARSRGPMVTLGQAVISFDSCHPALADQHYKRSPEHEELLEKERKHAARKSRSRSSKAHTRDLASRGVSGGSRRSGIGQTDQASGQLYSRADEAIRASRHGSAAHRIRSVSPSPGVSGRSRSPSPPSTRFAHGHDYNPRRTHSSPGVTVDPYQHLHQHEHGQPQGVMHGHNGQHLHAAEEPSFAGMSEHRRYSDQGYPHQPHDVPDTYPADGLLSRRSTGPALTGMEYKMATGQFDHDKYEEYKRQMDFEAEQRAIQRGYESDEERAHQIAAADAYAALTDEQRAALAAQQQEQDELQRLIGQSWEEQNGWMDEYRQRLGPREGYSSSRSASPAPGPHPQHGHGRAHDGSRLSTPTNYMTDMRTPSQGSPHHTRSEPGAAGSPLSPHEEDLVSNAFVPYLSEQLMREGYLRPGYHPGEGGMRAASEGEGPGRGRLRRRWSKPEPTIPRPFSFEDRTHTKPKSIMKVKCEQDLALRRQEEEAAKKYRFRANSVPRSNSPGLYEKTMLMAEVRRQINKDSRLEQLANMLEKPFSFQARDEERAAERAALVAAAKDPNRFRTAFYAKPVPESVKQDKFRLMMLELEAKRAGARERMEAARQAARDRVAHETASRQKQADRQYQDRLKTIDPVWNSKYITRRAGDVPDFNLLHNQWEQQLAKVRALNRRHMTAPEEFKTHNARTPEERAARDRKALERRQRILMDMALDAELLPDMRWPHKLPRGRVRPTPPPPASQPSHKVSDTRASILRRAATHKAKKAGQYREPAEREIAALERARKEAQIRAAAYIRMKQATGKDQDSYGSGVGGGSSFGGLATTAAPPDTSSRGQDQHKEGPAGLDAELAAVKSSKDVSKTKEVVESRDAGARDVPKDKDRPSLHAQARHAQAERQARLEIEEVLLEKGVYQDLRYMEEEEKARKGSSSKRY